MKLGIKKLHANEWQLHIDSAFVHLDRYSIELLYTNLDHLLSLNTGQESSVLAGLTKLAEKIMELSDAHMQLFLRDIDNQDLLKLMQVLDSEKLKSKILKNTGGILSKQLQADMETSSTPDEDEAIEAIKHIVESMFKLEATGKIEIINKEQKFI